MELYTRCNKCGSKIVISRLSRLELRELHGLDVMCKCGYEHSLKISIVKKKEDKE